METLSKATALELGDFITFIKQNISSLESFNLGTSGEMRFAFNSHFLSKTWFKYSWNFQTGEKFKLASNITVAPTFLRETFYCTRNLVKMKKILHSFQELHTENRINTFLLKILRSHKLQMYSPFIHSKTSVCDLCFSWSGSKHSLDKCYA